MFSAIAESLRVKQWTKNLIVFAALIFSLNFFDTALLLRSFFAFALFCAAASGTYFLNDVLDREQDRQHPTKSLRPIASGRLSVQKALLVGFLLLLLSVAGSFLLTAWLGWTITGYLVLQFFYSKYLKRVVILDIMVIAFGFVLRAVAGAVAIDVAISHWLLVTTLLLALFLGFGKRRHELMLLQENANTHRPVLTDYSPYFLDQMIGIVTASTVIVYMLYTTSSEATAHFGGPKLLYTMPFVLYGIFRYLYLIHQKDHGGDPSKTLLTDPPLIIDIILWAAIVIILLYYSHI
ncbi:MAG: decaprenyl-phosphate phosphoribosyltransferase [bacterium]